ncbi:MAG: hypothetical protein IPH94_06565 [Saprospiraceae bacterium]|nr:hypothetical protein [Saprospiraceae bacterium]MBK8850911.1 hypothetical protein [Saprospiraceae bacterium]MBK9688179.1 hypothetical protein [Saprospiraceae bacterium]
MVRSNKILLGLVFVFIGCSAHSNQGKLSKVEQISKLDEKHEIFWKDTTMICKCKDGIHSVKIESKYNDLSQDSIFVLNQKLIFMNDGVSVKTLELPFDRTLVEILNTKVRVNKSVLSEAKCLINKEGKVIYSFYGSHAFDPQHEFFSYNDENGKWLWYYYGDRYEAYKKFGDESRYKKEFGKEISSLNNMTKVFP